MSISDSVDRILLKPYLSASEETYHQARDLALVLLALAALLSGAIALSTSPPEGQPPLFGVIALCLGLLIVVRLGHLHYATAAAVLGLGGLASVTVFQGEIFNSYEIYALASIHLFVLSIATLLTNRPLYSYIAVGIGTAFMITHHITRALPANAPNTPAEIDDLIVCIGLIVLAGMITSRIVRRRQRLMQAVQDESAENRQRAVDLERSRTVLNAVIDQSPIPMIITAPDGTILNLNNALRAYAGEMDNERLKPGNNLSGLNLSWQVYGVDGVSIDLKERPLLAALQGVATHGRQMRYVLKDGTVKWAIQHATPVFDAHHNMIAAFSAFTDTTERETNERELRQSEEKYRSVIDNANMGIMVIQDGRLVFHNARMPQILGYTNQEYSEIDFMSTIHPADRELVVERIQERQKGLTTEANPLEVRALCKGGEMKWLETTSSTIEWDGKPALQAFAIDITERKRAEEATRESEEKYRNLIQHSGEAIYLLHNRKFEIINRKFENMFGVTLSDANSPTFDFMNLVAPKSRSIVEDRMKRHGMGEQLDPTYEFTALTADGRELDVEATVS